MQILGLVGPMLGILSAMAGPFMVAGASLGAMSGIVGLACAGGTIAAIAPVVDKRFTEYAQTSHYIGDYLKQATAGIKYAYDQTIGPSTDKLEWTGNDLAPEGENQGIFGEGY